MRLKVREIAGQSFRSAKTSMIKTNRNDSKPTEVFSDVSRSVNMIVESMIDKNNGFGLGLFILIAVCLQINFFTPLVDFEVNEIHFWEKVIALGIWLTMFLMLLSLFYLSLFD